MVKEKQKPNVLQLVSSLEIGGLEKLLVEFLKASKIHVEVANYTVVVMNNKVNEVLKEELLSIGYNVYFMNRQEGHKHPKYLFELLDIIKQNNIEIIHTHNSGGKYWSILCKIFNPKIKTVYTIHDSIIIKSLNGLKLLFHKIFIDKNIAISKAIYDDCIKKNIIKTMKIYNGINLDAFKIERENKTNSQLNIINIARITYYKKGHDILIKALTECKNKGLNFVCNFVGGVYDYDKESFEYLQELIEELNLSEYINFLGNRNNISELLAQSDLFILPSRYEGMPISLLEAMAAKIPVIASNISGSNDLITNGENGLLFESENYKNLADKIQYLYNNREVMGELANNAYKFVQDFDISIMCENYNKLYIELIGGGLKWKKL